MVDGDKIDVVKKSADVIKEALQADGILRVTFESPYRKQYFKSNMRSPDPIAK